MRTRPDSAARCARARGYARRLGALALLTVALARSAGADELPVLDARAAAGRLAAGAHVLMMRHAQTVPGLGDPPGFRVDDCATQRNLSDAGRAQARAIGRELAAAGIRFAQVRTSAWCRCRETAALAFGAASVWPTLNSFFADRAGEAAATAAVHALAADAADGHRMLVTHQVNITAVLGVVPAPGEIVAARPLAGRLVARFRIAPSAHAVPMPRGGAADELAAALSRAWRAELAACSPSRATR